MGSVRIKREVMKKQCPKCGEEKELTEFVRGENRCKVCQSLYAAQYRRNNYSIIKEKAAIWRLTNREHKNMIDREYSKTHRAESNKRAREWYLKNTVKAHETGRRNESKSIQQCSNLYIKKLLRATHGVIPSEITPDLIELKRQQITMKRILKQFKQFRKEKENESNSTNV